MTEHSTAPAEATTRENGGEQWYLGALNDGLFIINKPPRPSGEDAWHDRPDGPTLAISVSGLDVARAQSIVTAHNAALSTHQQQGTDSDQRLIKSAMDYASWDGIPSQAVAFIALLCGRLEVLSRAPQPDAEVKRLQNVIERDRSAVADIWPKIREAMRAREWLRLGRGSYEFDDERWKDEFGVALDEIRAACDPLIRIAANLTDSQKAWDDVVAARTPLPETSWKRMSDIPDFLDCPSHILVWNDCNGVSEIAVQPDDIYKFREHGDGWLLWREVPVPAPHEKAAAVAARAAK